MKYLLDTHTLLWFLSGSEEMSSRARQIIENPATTKYVSVVSLWEIAIKSSLGKLALVGAYEDLANDVTHNGFLLLGLTFEHARQVHSLPLYHRDPFDRMLIAQALAEGMDFISRDGLAAPYFAGSTSQLVW